MSRLALIDVEIRHFHMACGIGGGARGFNRAHARVGRLRSRMRCIGGIDVDPAACRDFARFAGVPATCLDLFSRAQYTAFHGHEPPPTWREATVDDIRAAAGGERPHIVFSSFPCKGFSGLLSEKASGAAKYVALNGLTVRGNMLLLEAFKDDPPELLLFENVPRIATRGRGLLDQIIAVWRAHGYAVAEYPVHDCGELGNLGQSRKRFLMVGRHMAKVPPFLYQPERRPLRGVGEIIGALPVPGPEPVLPMHRLPALQWKTWARLAFVPAGKDWRALNELTVEDGVLRDFALVPESGFRTVLGVTPWDRPAGTVTSESRPTNGAHSVADPRLDTGGHEFGGLRVVDWKRHAGAVTTQRGPGSSAQSVADPRSPRVLFNHAYRVVRFDQHSPAVAGGGGAGGGLAVADPRPVVRDDYKQNKYRVTRFDEPGGAVIAASSTGNGSYAVADPRTGFGPGTHHHVLKVTAWDQPGGTVTASHHPAGGALSVADPRTGYGPDSHRNKLAVVGWARNAGTVTGSDRVGSGALSVADPRPSGLNRPDRADYLSGGHYGVVPWDEPSRAVPGYSKNNNGPWSVADPRGLSAFPSSNEEEKSVEVLPAGNDRLVCVIISIDGTWHRPFTTLELAALQGLVDPDAVIDLDGASDSAKRERIGNMVPPPAAEAVGSVMARTLLAAWSGETFILTREPIWVREHAVALMAAQGDPA